MVLQEMWWNSVPRRIMKECMAKSKQYDLGVSGSVKRSWLIILAREVYQLRLGGEVCFEDFVVGLEELWVKRGYSMGMFMFNDEINGSLEKEKEALQSFGKEAVSEVGRKGRKERKRKIMGARKVVVTYRNEESMRMYEVLSKYEGICPVFRHEGYFSIKRLMRYGFRRNSMKRKERRSVRRRL